MPEYVAVRTSNGHSIPFEVDDDFDGPVPAGRRWDAAVGQAVDTLDRGLDRIKEMAGDVKASWGDQMRSYVLNPYQMVKDLRTEHEEGNTSAVFDGAIDSFLENGIRWRRQQDRLAQQPA